MVILTKKWTIMHVNSIFLSSRRLRVWDNVQEQFWNHHFGNNEKDSRIAFSGTWPLLTQHKLRVGIAVHPLPICPIQYTLEVMKTMSFTLLWNASHWLLMTCHKSCIPLRKPKKLQSFYSVMSGKHYRTINTRRNRNAKVPWGLKRMSGVRPLSVQGISSAGHKMLITFVVFFCSQKDMLQNKKHGTRRRLVRILEQDLQYEHTFDLW